MSALMLLSICGFSNNSTMGVNWTFPYFSGAANINSLFKWEISPSDFDAVRSVVGAGYNLDEYKYYKHKTTDDAIINTVNNYGYVLIVWLSMQLFPYLGDIQGVLLLQIIVHFIASLFIILHLIRDHFNKVIFILIYAANPLIMHFVTYPFYYSWMFVPSLLFAIAVLRKEWLIYLLAIAAPVLLFSILIRPTTLFISILFFIFAFFISNRASVKFLTLIMFGVFSFGVFFISKNSTGSPWHTIYIGVGAYENNLGVPDLGDNRGYEYFYQKTGIKINTDAIYGNYNDEKIHKTYMNSLKNRYFEIITEDPIQLIKNAIQNGVKVFSIGYLDRYPSLSWLINIQAIMLIAFLIYAKQYIWIFAVVSSAFGFFLYFPPVPSYNFGAYLLLVFGFLSAISHIRNKAL
jgi:hypothetical protein